MLNVRYNISIIYYELHALIDNVAMNIPYECPATKTINYKQHNSQLVVI